MTRTAIVKELESKPQFGRYNKPPGQGGRGGHGGGNKYPHKQREHNGDFKTGQFKPPQQREREEPMDPFKRQEADLLKTKLVEESKVAI